MLNFLFSSVVNKILLDFPTPNRPARKGGLLNFDSRV